MEATDALPEMNWSTFDKTVMADDAEFMSQLLRSSPLANEQGCDPCFGCPEDFWSSLDTKMEISDTGSSPHCSSPNCFPPVISNGLCMTNSESLSINSAKSTKSMPTMNRKYSDMNLCTENEQTPSLVQIAVDTEFDHLKEEMNDGGFQELSARMASERCHPDQGLLLRSQFKMAESDNMIKKMMNISPKKRTLASGHVLTKSAKMPQLEKNEKVTLTNDDEEYDAASFKQSLSSYSSEDDSNTSQEINSQTSSSFGGSPTDGKTRPLCQSAADPQSLYTRRKIGRINERLRILQNLVPNGTKVDISTMLEEAVQYVKFLQLQIKLLSSDELWMYAPILYSAKDIGLELKTSSP